jgi:hypothetical protein
MAWLIVAAFLFSVGGILAVVLRARTDKRRRAAVYERVRDKLQRDADAARTPVRPDVDEVERYTGRDLRPIPPARLARAREPRDEPERFGSELDWVFERRAPAIFPTDGAVQRQIAAETQWAGDDPPPDEREP